MRFKDKQLMFLLFAVLLSLPACGQSATEATEEVIVINDLAVGAERMEEYLPMLKGKSVAILANPTSMVKNVHLVDTLLSLKIAVKKVFCPEHGFRGDADNGEHIKNYTDKKTGLPIISLYGNNKKPKAADLKGIDIVIFDVQDVGARFYTYLSSMHYMMEACAENKIKFFVLDRPNPNGFYVDGPVLEKAFKSFVGMHPVPVVHGMTVAEYARMINEEGWLQGGIKCDLQYISIENYDHKYLYELPIKPSPNLPDMNSIYLYPSLCLFEGTIVSVGRGTEKPFQIIGHPLLKNTTFSFTPVSIPGASKNPPYKEIVCFGYDLSEQGEKIIQNNPRLHLQWLIKTYANTADKSSYFNNFFNNLAGNATLKKQIVDGVTEEEIRKSWEKDLKIFKLMRKKYLIYKDFE